jgi:hypothetical protein
MQEWEEYFMKLLEGRKEKGKAETGMADARGNRNHSRRGRMTNKETEKKKSTGEVKVEEKEGK